MNEYEELKRKYDALVNAVKKELADEQMWSKCGDKQSEDKAKHAVVVIFRILSVAIKEA